jgi:RNA polymerase sigma factor (sigma-70 family)
MSMAVRRALDSLDPDDTALVRLQHFDGLTHAEIAKRLGIPVGTVKSRTFRAHRRLALLLGHVRGDAGTASASVDGGGRAKGGSR